MEGKSRDSLVGKLRNQKPRLSILGNLGFKLIGRRQRCE